MYLGVLHASVGEQDMPFHHLYLHVVAVEVVGHVEILDGLVRLAHLAVGEGQLLIDVRQVVLASGSHLDGLLQHLGGLLAALQVDEA